ncbi:MAG: DUF5658 family protein [Kofleriaceae bacterium]
MVILNLLDAIFTLCYTHSGVASESNPMMQVALAAHPVLFVLAKISLVSLGVLLLWRMRHVRAAAFGLIGTTAAYSLLLLYHLSAVPHLI